MSIHPATLYALEAVEGGRVVGETERLACQRHLFDLGRAGQLSGGLRQRVVDVCGEAPAQDAAWPWAFDKGKADRIYKWFGYCKHVEGPLAGTPIELMPFQQFDLGVIFGWVDRVTGNRRFEKAYIQMARKNAKTTELAGGANYLMVGDGEMSPSVYCAAVDRGQARLVYEAAKAMAEQSPNIAKRLKIRDYRISHVSRGGRMMALSKQTRNKDGLHPSGAIIDEYHAHPSSEIYDVIWSAWGQRAQALMAIITTSGEDTESPCYREYSYCKLILGGEATNERYFVMIRELDKADDEHDPAMWIKSNPLRAATAEGLARLKDQHDEAFGSKDPAKVRTFRVKNLDTWVHAPGGADAYMGEIEDWQQKWDRMAVSREVFRSMTQGLLCVVGIDLSKKIDLTADFTLFDLGEDMIAVSAMGYMPEEGMIRHERTDKVPYRHYADAGWLTVTPGNVTDYRYIQENIGARQADYGWKVHEITYDPYNATQFANQMTDEGFTMIEVPQQMRYLSEPTKLFREKLAEGKIVHDGSPLLKMCIANAVQIVDSKENIMVTKKYAGSTKRVDLLAAGLTAMTRYQPLCDASRFMDDIGV